MHRRAVIRSRKTATIWTLALTFILLLVYKLEQFFVFMTGAISPNSLLESIEFPLNLGVYLLSPLLHSNGDHLATNLFWFILFGAILEQRVGLRDYFGFILSVGIVGNFVAPFLGQLLGFSVTFAIGLSGVTNALGMRETIYRAVVLSDPERSTRSHWMIFLIAISATVLSAFILLQGETKPGNSAVAHGTGLFLGVVFGLAEVNVFIDTYDWFREQYEELIA